MSYQMAKIDLRYGTSAIEFEFDPARFEVIGNANDQTPMTDVEIGERFDSPIDSPRFDEMIGVGETVLIVVPDATRKTASAVIVDLLIRRLIANGSKPFDIRIIFATSIHRRVTENEKAEILGAFIAQRIRTLDHDPRDLMKIVDLGRTESGVPIELNRALFEHDHVIAVGGVSFHYFAGFTGGRKLICPGLASSRTVAATHKLAFDCTKMDRRKGVNTGLLDGNAVHEAFVEVASHAKPAFAINSLVDDDGRITGLFCGDWITSHRAACEKYSVDHTIELSGKRALVIASCGGSPFDINLIQAQKALNAASRACSDGGTIVLLAECGEGTGRKDFLDWFSSTDSAGLARRLCENYKVNGQTAWNLLRQTERFDVRIVTKIDPESARRMRFIPEPSLADAIKAAPEGSGYIFTNASKVNVTTA